MVRPPRPESFVARHHPTVAVLHLDRLSHNVQVLRRLAGGRPLWPAIKANAYGHGALPVAHHLVSLGIDTLCVAHATEAVALTEAGIDATFVLLSATLPDVAEKVVAHGFEPAVATVDTVDALSHAAVRQQREAVVHVKVDTGMGRVGVTPDDVVAFVDHCRGLPGVRVRGVMSHFPRADEADPAYSLEQVRRFEAVRAATAGRGIEVYHLANSAGLLQVPGCAFDAARPGIAMYGLTPDTGLVAPALAELQPVLEWRTRVTFVKEVPAGTSLSYGHTFTTTRPSLVATIPVGYGDGLPRRLSDDLDVLVHGIRCPVVGRVTMDQTLVDVTGVAGGVGLGDPVVLVGRDGNEEIGVAELADRLGTITYEVTTGIAARVPRVVADPSRPV